MVQGFVVYGLGVQLGATYASAVWGDIPPFGGRLHVALNGISLCICLLVFLLGS